VAAHYSQTVKQPINWWLMRIITHRNGVLPPSMLRRWGEKAAHIL